MPSIAYATGLYPVTSSGAPIIVGNPFVSAGRTAYFVDSTIGGDGGDGLSPHAPLDTMAEAFTRVVSGDTIYFRGNVTENLTAPAGIFDITIVGLGNRQRHADAHTDNNGYNSATWKASSQSDPLLVVRQQGWRFYNILFDAPTSDAALEFIRDAASGDSERDSSHAEVINCRFASGQTGILISGTENIFNVKVADCQFHDLTNAIDSPGAYAYRWDISNNIFDTNTNHIDVGFARSVIRNNVFGAFTTQGIDLTGGSGNIVVGNALSGTYSIVGGYTPGTDDEWGGNFNSLTGGVTAADPA